MTDLPTSTRLHHIALGARDVDGVAAFYAEVFGLEERARHHYDDGRLRSVWLDVDGTLLMVEHTTQPARHVDGVGAGPFLLAFSVADGDARRAFEQRLADRGVDVEDRTGFSSYFRDPEGNRVAVSHYPDSLPD